MKVKFFETTKKLHDGSEYSVEMIECLIENADKRLPPHKTISKAEAVHKKEYSEEYEIFLKSKGGDPESSLVGKKAKAKKEKSVNE